MKKFKCFMRLILALSLFLTLFPLNSCMLFTVNAPSVESIIDSKTELTTSDDRTTENPQSDEDTQGQTEDDGYMESDGHAFINDGVYFYLGENIARVLSELGPENDYYEYASCSFDGTAKVYYYSGYELATYKRDKNDCDRLYSISLTDDGVSTAEGLFIGQAADDIFAIYGDDYEQLIEGVYRYIKAGTVLSVTVENDVVTAILYSINEIYG